jgi:TolB protein
MRTISLLISSSFCLLLLASPLFAQPRTLDEIQRRGGAEVVTINITGAPEESVRLARRAFGVHGAFTIVPNQPQFTLRLSQTTPGQISFQLVEGAAGREVASGTGRGTSIGEATLRAADQVVERLTRTPGFFAGRLAFVGDRSGNREIFISDVFFTSVRQLTRDQSEVLLPRWSPDGRFILYTTFFRSGFPDLFRIEVANGRRTPFATFEGTNSGGVFSPNGQSVAMTLSSPGNAEIFISDSEGRNPRRLTRNNSLEATPSWSPDGSRLVFTSDQPGRPQLFEINVSGGPMRRIPTNISGYCAEPAWNPVHDNLIAFTISQGGSFRIAVYDSITRTTRVLTEGANDVIEPSWANDGRHLFVTVRSGAFRQIHLLDTATGRLSPLHNRSLGNAFQAAFVLTAN